MFFELGVKKNFAGFTEKGLCWSPFLIKLKSLSQSETIFGNWKPFKKDEKFISPQKLFPSQEI